MSDPRALPESAEPPARYDPADASIPRTSVLKEFENTPGPCLHCGEELHLHSHTYLVATRRGSELGDPFILGGDFGWFCLNCPAVVLNKQKVEKILMAGQSRWDIGDNYVVVGIVDLDAVPDSKRNMPFGDDNPIPLVQFTNIGQSRRKPSRRSRASKEVRTKRKQQKKARRRSRRRR